MGYRDVSSHAEMRATKAEDRDATPFRREVTQIADRIGTHAIFTQP